MEKQQDKKQSVWKLVKVDELPVAPGVEEARARWVGKEVWCLTPWGQWRRGKVEYITNVGSVRVVIYQKGTPGIAVSFGMEHIMQLLKPAGR